MYGLIHLAADNSFQNEIAHLSDQWQIAAHAAEKMQGAWLAIKDDLNTVEQTLNDPGLFATDDFVLELNQQSIEVMWSNVCTEIDKMIAAKNTGFVYGYTA